MPFRPEPRPLCGAMNRRGFPCGKRAVDGHWRCKHHGGLSVGPRRLFESFEQREARVAKAVAQMQEGRRLWLAGLKARGEKAPCGRKPRGFDPLLASLNRLHRERAKADGKRIEAPYRRHMRDCELEAQRRAEQERVQAELRRIAEENDNPAKRPNETREENAMRFACIMERRRREQQLLLYEQIEGKARAGGFYRCEPIRFTASPR